VKSDVANARSGGGVVQGGMLGFGSSSRDLQLRTNITHHGDNNESREQRCSHKPARHTASTMYVARIVYATHTDPV
jgi:hypothetical protein